MLDQNDQEVMPPMYARTINVTYDTTHYPFSATETDGYRETNALRGGTITADLIITDHQMERWSNYINQMGVPAFGRANFSTVHVGADRNSSTFRNAFLSSVNWSINEGPNLMMSEMTWRFSTVHDVHAVPPRELRTRREENRKVDWRSQGF